MRDRRCGPSETELVYLVDGPAEVALRAGETARLAVTVGTHARADLALEAHLISPWGTWEWIGPGRARRASCRPVAASSSASTSRRRAWLEPGQWWALVRVGCAGRLVYSPAVTGDRDMSVHP